MLQDRLRLFEGGRGPLGDTMCQVCNLVQPHGNLKVVETDRVGVGQDRCSSFVRDELWNVRGDGVSDAGRRGKWQVDPAHGIGLHSEKLAAYKFSEGSRKQD